MDIDTLLGGLDESQRRAVTTPGQPLCILAGAGSGKTRVLTRRIAYRCLSDDIDPRRVLALTFTRKAAGELTSRLRSFGLRDVPAAGTFHASAYAQLRDRWAGADIRPPTLLERKTRVLVRVLGGSRGVSPTDLAVEIEWAKARLIAPADYAYAAEQADRRTPASPARIAELYRRYEEEKHQRRLVDFDDLLARCADAIDTDPSFAAAQRWRFRHLFVDEYQDVNPLQERLLRAWLGKRLDLCVVGDPNQAIYRWNGADASYLIDFGRHHPDAEIVELTENYRSTPEILAVAASVLAGPRARPRPLRSHNSTGPIPMVTEFDTDIGEALGVARAVRDEHGLRMPWSSQAVLVRTNAQTALIESALRKVGIPYRVRGGRALLEEPAVRELLSGLARSNEPFATTMADLRAALVRTAGAAVDEPTDDEGLPMAPFDVDGADSPEARRHAALDAVAGLGEEFLVLDRNAPASAFPAWLATVVRSEEPDRSGDAVTLATYHAAKGLEWPVVHLAGLEDGFSPIKHANGPAAQNEERRLVYVAVTRATQALRMTWARSRTFGDRAMQRSPSPYLRQVLAATALLREEEDVLPSPGSELVETRARLDDSRPAWARTGRAPVGPSRPEEVLLETLRRWREGVARAARVAPSVVLADRTLRALARRRPANRAELQELPGLGPIATEQYGAALLAMVAGHPVVADGRN